MCQFFGFATISLKASERNWLTASKELGAEVFASSAAATTFSGVRCIPTVLKPSLAISPMEGMLRILALGGRGCCAGNRTTWANSLKRRACSANLGVVHRTPRSWRCRAILVAIAPHKGLGTQDLSVWECCEPKEQTCAWSFQTGNGGSVSGNEESQLKKVSYCFKSVGRAAQRDPQT